MSNVNTLLYIPENKPLEWIDRPHLMRRVRDGLVKSKQFLAFFSAPGGYGKTVIATQFLGGVRGPKKWIAVSSPDNEQSYFYERLARAAYGLVGTAPPEHKAGYSLETLLSALDNLPGKRAHGYIALDDLHLLTNEEILSRLPLIFSRMPGWISMLITSRHEPPESLSALNRTMTVFTYADLSFSLGEAASLYEFVTEEEETPENKWARKEHVERLYAQSGGWAMGLCALLLDTGANATQDKSRTPGQLSEYLDKRVWDSWEPETRELLMRLSVADTLTPQLAALLSGHSGGGAALTRLKRLGVFLSHGADDVYRFHELFLGYLRERAEEGLAKEERARLRDITALWAYRRGRYLEALRYYIENRDFSGIDLCVKATARFDESMPLEVQYHFYKLYFGSMDEAFIFKSPYLLEPRIWVAYLDGESELFARYLDVLFEMLPKLAPEHPELVETAGFIGGLDFNTPLPVYARRVSTFIGNMPPPSPDKETQTSNVTQELPFFHRSMRDFSEYHELDNDELELLRKTFGVMIGRDYQVMDNCLIAGLCYEKNNLLRAAYHATQAYYACDDAMQAETVFCANMIMAAVLTAMNDNIDADRIYTRTDSLIKAERASFLRPNFRAMQTRRAIQNGDKKEARDWLAMYAPIKDHMPFYQICRHFTTLRAYAALGEYTKALDFGKRLRKLAIDYKRPLDVIESEILLAVSMWEAGEQTEALRYMKSAIKTAMPYGFTRLFVNEGNAVLPLLLATKEELSGTKALGKFEDRLLEETYAFTPSGRISVIDKPRLTPRGKELLRCMARGFGYVQIAEATGMSRASVKYHTGRLYKEMGVSGAREAVVKARLLGLLD